jgi:hypothetical protein
MGDPFICQPAEAAQEQHFLQLGRERQDDLPERQGLGL